MVSIFRIRITLPLKKHEHCIKHQHQVSQPGQPHISQAVGGEVVEVGEGGQVQEDHQGQVKVKMVLEG